jgi:hypothetical protein
LGIPDPGSCLMLDVILIAAGVVSFALTLIYVLACEKM